MVRGRVGERGCNSARRRDVNCANLLSAAVGHGYIAQWLERLTADQQVPGSNPGMPSFDFCFADQSALAAIQRG